MNYQTYSYAGMFTTALRWVAGWTYFSAFWRRLVLENKLDPEAPGYIGEKFNHFLPHALGIQPVIKYLVSNPETLWWAMAAFTIIEGVVGLCFMLGLLTRLMSIGVFSLALGILLGSGWLGTTCLDEWQIGVLGVAAGFTIFLSGGGRYALDAWFLRQGRPVSRKKWLLLAGSGPLPFRVSVLNKMALGGSVAITVLTLFTNQYFHGGVYGPLHNLSVHPHVSVTEASVQDGTLSFVVFRDEGADVYGSFLIGVALLDHQGQPVFTRTQDQLSQLQTHQVSNDYVARVRPGKHSLVLPLGARARLYFYDDTLSQLSGHYTLVLTDISGTTWETTIYIG